LDAKLQCLNLASFSFSFSVYGHLITPWICLDVLAIFG
jgi:hypothetical protein